MGVTVGTGVGVGVRVGVGASAVGDGSGVGLGGTGVGEGSLAQPATKSSTIARKTRTLSFASRVARLISVSISNVVCCCQDWPLFELPIGKALHRRGTCQTASGAGWVSRRIATLRYLDKELVGVRPHRPSNAPTLMPKVQLRRGVAGNLSRQRFLLYQRRRSSAPGVPPKGTEGLARIKEA